MFNWFKKKTPAPDPTPQVPEELAEKVAEHFDSIVPTESIPRPYSERTHQRYLAALRLKEAMQAPYQNALHASSQPADQSGPQYAENLLRPGPARVYDDAELILPLALLYPCGPFSPSATDDCAGQSGTFDGAGASSDWDSSSTTGSTE